MYCGRESRAVCAESAVRKPEAGARAVHQQRSLLGAWRASYKRRGSHTGPCHLFLLSSRLTYSSFLFCEFLHCSLILQAFEETVQMQAEQPENNCQLEFIIKQLHSSQFRPLILKSSRSYFLWLSFTITILSLSLYNSKRYETARKNGFCEATARDGADSDVEMTDDEFEHEVHNCVEHDLDLNEVLRIEAGERSGERLLLGEFYAPSQPPKAGGVAGGLSNVWRAGSARDGGVMNAGAAGDTPLMLPMSTDARRAAAENCYKKDPGAAAPVLGASSKTRLEQVQQHRDPPYNKSPLQRAERRCL